MLASTTKTPASLGYPLSVFNKNFTLKTSEITHYSNHRVESRRKERKQETGWVVRGEGGGINYSDNKSILPTSTLELFIISDFKISSPPLVEHPPSSHPSKWVRIGFVQSKERETKAARESLM